MSVRSELRTLIRLAPEVDTTVLSDADANTLLSKAQIDLALKGRALPKNVKINAVAEQQEYVLSGASAVVDDDDFLAVDLQGGGVLFNDGSNWLGEATGFVPKTKEWLDRHYSDWRSNSSTATPLYWYVDSGEETENLVLGLVDKPSAAGTNTIWVHYLGRGVLMTGDTHYPWTGSTTELPYLTPYDPLLVYYVLEWVTRLITKNHQEADRYKALYEEGAQRMAMRLPLMDQVAREGMRPHTPLQTMMGRGRRA